jgi:chromosome segregation ATPase
MDAGTPAEFLAACLALASGSAVPPDDDPKMSSDEARADSTQRATASPERDQTTSHRPSPNDAPDTEDVIRRLKTRVEHLREQHAEILRENDVLRQSLASVREQRSADGKALEDFLNHQESDIRSEVETLNQVLLAMTADRDAALTGEREAERREAQLRNDLQSLREELELVKMRYDNTTKILDTALHEGRQARADLTDAMTMASERDSEVERLRQTITQRDREVDELRQHLLEAEEARVADAAAFLDSLIEHRI